MGSDSHLKSDGQKKLRNIPQLTGECPTMQKAAYGIVWVLEDYEKAGSFVENMERDSPWILVTREFDWSWTRILENFAGVISDDGTRVSRASEVLGMMGKPGVLGTGNATEILRSGARALILCEGSKGYVYLVE